MKHPKLACTAGRRYRLPKLFERRGDGTRVVVVIVEADVAAVDVVDVAVVYSYRTYLLSIWNPREDRGKALLSDDILFSAAISFCHSFQIEISKKSKC